jgi:molybdate transport system regulatory protein
MTSFVEISSTTKPTALSSSCSITRNSCFKATPRPQHTDVATIQPLPSSLTFVMKTSAATAIVSKHYVRRGRAYVFGPGKADLLERIQKTGSIAAAAKEMEMSYMRAWQLVKGMNRGWREPLVITTRGGAKRGGTAISATGKEVLRLYRKLETAADQATAATAMNFDALLK